jgi:hypothetical protein
LINAYMTFRITLQIPNPVVRYGRGSLVLMEELLALGGGMSGGQGWCIADTRGHLGLIPGDAWYCWSWPLQPGGLLISDRIIGKDAIKSTLIKGWKPTMTTIFKALGDNLFLVELEHLWDKSQVLEGQP